MMTVIFVWGFLIGCEIFRNCLMIDKKKMRPVYWQSNVGRIAIGFLFWVASPVFIWKDMTYWQWWGMIPMMLFSFWFFFDYGLNLARKKKPFYYLNPEGSFLDKLQCNYPASYPWFWWKFMLMYAGIITFYYGMDALWNGV